MFAAAAAREVEVIQSHSDLTISSIPRALVGRSIVLAQHNGIPVLPGVRARVIPLHGSKIILMISPHFSDVSHGVAVIAGFLSLIVAPAAGARRKPRATAN